MRLPKVFAQNYTIAFQRLLFLHSVQSVNKITEGINRVKFRFTFGIFFLGLTSTMVATDEYGNRKSRTSPGVPHAFRKQGMIF